ncbi:MAG: AHH domain-containing protein, partial [Spirochaetales bacterium]|nr:AHH domain-containing protein [Spirochaetales bacterium]
DEETGLYYFGARYLDPQTSRWISPDPAGPELLNPNRNGFSMIESINWYSYVSNNPVKYIDPTGNFKWTPEAQAILDSYLQNPQAGISVGALIKTAGIWALPILFCLCLQGSQVQRPAPPGFVKHNGYFFSPDTGLVSNGEAWDAYNSGSIRVRPIQTHHWINQATVRGNNPHDIAGVLSKMGVSLDESWNKGDIPHVGGHTKEYYDFVRKELNNVMDEYEASGESWSPDEMRDVLKQTAQNIKDSVMYGEVNLYKPAEE